MTTKQAAVLGSVIGIIYLLLWLPALYLSIVSSFFHTTFDAELANAVVGTFGNFCYLPILYALLKVSKERGERRFTIDLTLALIAAVALMVLGAIDFRELFAQWGALSGLIVFIVSWLLYIPLGAINLRLATDFTRLAAEYQYATKASFWNRISGWIMVTVVFAPIGSLISVIADYFMWRVVVQKARAMRTPSLSSKEMGYALAVFVVLCAVTYGLVQHFFRPVSLEQQVATTLEQYNNTAWESYTSVIGQFQADFPSLPPHVTSGTYPATANSPAIPFTLYASQDAEGNYYAIMVVLYPPSLNLSNVDPKVLLEGAANGSAIASHGTLISSNFITYETYPGIIYVVKVPSYYAKVQAILVGRKLYMTELVSSSSAPTTFTRFADSLRIGTATQQ